jgi:uncharacterized protein YecT (DUF1311 family)
MAVWDLALFVAGIAAAAAGYGIKRWWEGQSFRERLQEATGLAALKQHLDQGGSLGSLEELKAQLRARRSAQEETELEVLDQIELEFRTQLEMNLHEGYLLEIAEKQLEYLSGALIAKLDERERSAFEMAQEAWRVFAHRHAEFASLIVEGGSMQPMMHAAELKALTVERAGQVKQEIKQRQELLE